ncbi:MULTISPECIES: hypothetical protein [Solirubrobacterales]|nr:MULTISPECIES: hypothetical protein [Solirubrobacterales]
MGHRMMGRAHAALHHCTTDLRRRLAAETGQGTVEYVALILLVAGVLAAVVTAGVGKEFDLGETIMGKLKDSVDGVGEAPGKK